MTAALGGADCEAVAAAWLAQPSAAVSSTAYVLAGAWLAARARRRRGRRAAAGAALGLAMAGVGVGSVAYHGPQPGWAGAAHDQSIVVLLLGLAVLVGHGLHRVRGRRAVGGWVAAGAIGAALCAVSGQSAAVPAVLGVALVAGTAGPAGSGAAPLVGVLRLWGGPLAVLAAGLVAYAAGATGSPLCRPGSVAQPHALWHVLSAAALAWAAHRLVDRQLPPGAHRGELPSPPPPSARAGASAASPGAGARGASRVGGTASLDGADR